MPGSLKRVVRAQVCEAYNRHGEKCDRNAEAAVTENGDYVPVCSFHKGVAMNVGWAIGPLRSNSKLTPLEASNER